MMIQFIKCENKREETMEQINVQLASQEVNGIRKHVRNIRNKCKCNSFLIGFIGNSVVCIATLPCLIYVIYTN